MLTLVQVVHLGGLSALTRNLLYRYVRKQIPQRRVWVPSCTFGGKQAQTATFPFPRKCRCHPEAAKSPAKRTTPNEEPALSPPKGPMQPTETPAWAASHYIP
jgi:hypothetical protein